MKKKILFLISLVTFFFVLSPKLAMAQVVINELNTDGSSDWIELYSSEDVDISGWILRDTTSEVETFDPGTLIGPSSNQFVVADVTNRLNNPGDVVTLYLPDGVTIKDSISYGNQGGVCAPTAPQTIGRVPDANATIERFSIGTQGVSNTAPLNPCPTPTPGPTSTPTPTPSPTLTPTSTPTLTPKPTISPTKSPTPTKASEEENPAENSSDSVVLGLREELNGKDEASGEGEPKKKFPAIAILITLLGVGFISFSVFVFIKGKRKDYNNVNEESS